MYNPYCIMQVLHSGGYACVNKYQYTNQLEH